MPTATNIHNFITMYDRLCEDVSLKTSRYEENCKCALILFQKNLDHQFVYEQILTDTFVDWDHVQVLPTYTLYKDPNSWITLLHFLNCDEDGAKWKTLNSKHKIFSYFSDTLNNFFPTITHENVIKLFLLLNISNLQALSAFELFFANISNVNIREKAFLFFSHLADEQFDKTDRTTCLVYLLHEIITVRTEDIANEVEILNKNKDNVRDGLKQRNLRAVIKRPQLRSKLCNFDLVVDDSFKTWKERIRFANCFSIVNAKRLYFLLSQTHVVHDKYVHRFVREDELRTNLIANPVKKSDIDTIVEVIQNTRICCAPFPELHVFRDKGIASFSMSQKSRLRLNDLLHLYLAAYQVEWKAVWRSIIPILSSQIIHDVTDFVTEHPFNADAALDIMFNND